MNRDTDLTGYHMLFDRMGNRVDLSDADEVWRFADLLRCVVAVFLIAASLAIYLK